MSILDVANVSVVVLYVKSASSTSSPPVLANVSLPGVKSSIFAEAIVAFVSTSKVLFLR